MELEQRLAAIEDEFKVIKGELKQTLTDVRAFLMQAQSPINDDTRNIIPRSYKESFELRDRETKQEGKAELQSSPRSPQGQPSGSFPEASPALYARQPGYAAPSMANLSFPAGAPPSAQQIYHQHYQRPASPAAVPQTPLKETLAAPGSSDWLSVSQRLHTLTQEQRQQSAPGAGEQVEEAIRMLLKNMKQQDKPGGAVEDRVIPDVNLLTNLIRWVSLAKRRIGSEHLPSLLKLYEFIGQPYLEFKQIIISLVDMVDEQSAVNDNSAEAWIDLILQLHGILTTGNVPVRPFNLAGEREGMGSAAG